MSPLNKTHTHYLHQIVGLLAIIIVVAAGGGLTQVWLRQCISASAERIRQYEGDLAEYERRIQYYDTQIAKIHNPETLKTYAANLGLGLRAPETRQMVVLRDPVMNRFSMQEPDTAIAEVKDPFKVTFDLALIDASQPQQ